MKSTSISLVIGKVSVHYQAMSIFKTLIVKMFAIYDKFLNFLDYFLLNYTVPVKLFVHIFHSAKY